LLCGEEFLVDAAKQFDEGIVFGEVGFEIRTGGGLLGEDFRDASRGGLKADFGEFV
jgi:hypothetical protein